MPWIDIQLKTKPNANPSRGLVKENTGHGRCFKEVEQWWHEASDMCKGLLFALPARGPRSFDLQMEQGDSHLHHLMGRVHATIKNILQIMHVPLFGESNSIGVELVVEDDK